MNRSLLPALALALVGACSSGAANRPDPGMPGAMRSASDAAPEGARGDESESSPLRVVPYMRGISLTSDQEQRIAIIHDSYRSRLEQARQAAGSDLVLIRSRVQPLIDREQADLRAVLGADQQPQFDRNVKASRDCELMNPSPERRGRCPLD